MHTPKIRRLPIFVGPFTEASTLRGASSTNYPSLPRPRAEFTFLVFGAICERTKHPLTLIRPVESA